MVFNATFNNISVISWRGSKVDKNLKKNHILFWIYFSWMKVFFLHFQNLENKHFINMVYNVTNTRG
jgi:hypothetical protein